MADSEVLTGLADGSSTHLHLLQKDVGNSQHVPGVMLVGADGLAGESSARVAIAAAAELTRPSDTTAYAALDNISNSTSAPTAGGPFQPTVARANGGSGYIVGARLHTDQKTNVARFRLQIFHTAPTAINDNSPYLSLYANKAKRTGYIDIPAMATEDPTSSTQATAQNFDVRLPFKCASADSKVYIMLEALDAFTPASGQKFYLELLVDQN